jgi:crotonobetainyl-CoA:carnitine CoA-transferase CaiB-like acyl-CoA transferase
MTGSLDGITVLDLTQGAAGALATMFLSDHGAKVIRCVESDAQAVRDGGYRVWDRGKAIVRVTATSVDGERLDGRFERLLGAADVLIEDHAPGLRSAALAYGRLRVGNPRLVACSLTAYGEHGAYRDEPAIDDLVLARTGVLSGMPGFRPAPIHVVHPLPSTGAGILAALGIAAALLAREKTGLGRHVATSLVAGALLYHPKVESEHLAPHVFQTNPYGSAPFYSVYACSDEEWIQLGCVHPGFIARAAELMGIGELIADPVYGRGHAPQTAEADAHLRGVVAEVMRSRSASAWAEVFESKDIPFARARTTQEGMDDPQVLHNGMVVNLDDPAVGPMMQMGVPVRLSGTPGSIQGPRAAVAREPEAFVTPASEALPMGPAGAPSRDDETASALPLAGVRVLEITNLIAGPMAGRLLADLGADVMKLEPPAGDISRPIGRTYFYSVNYAKRSIAVDTARPEGKAIVARIAKSCDVLLANLRPGATSRMGIGNDVDANLIETQVSGYGMSGPYAHRPGIDPLAQALMGLERAQGGDGNPPSFPAQLAPTDFTTGTMAALGTVLALYVRACGRHAGQRVELNLLDGAVLLSSEWFTRYASRPERPLADRGQHGPGPFHRLYETATGFVYVAAGDDDARTRLLAALGLDAAGHENDDGRHANETSLALAMATAFAGLDRQAACSLLSRADVPFAPVEPAESKAFFDDPNHRLNGWAVTRPHAIAGKLTSCCRYLQFDGAAPQDIRPTPLLGEHTDDILREAGFSPGEIAQLRSDALVLTEGALGDGATQ